MRLSEYIRELQELLECHGDLPVEAWTPALGRRAAPLPTLAYQLKVQDGPRGGTARGTRNDVMSFWHETDHPSLRGNAVIRIKG